jgi:hypothetical protein
MSVYFLRDSTRRGRRYAYFRFVREVLLSFFVRSSDRSTTSARDEGFWRLSPGFLSVYTRLCFELQRSIASSKGTDRKKEIATRGIWKFDVSTFPGESGRVRRLY